MRTLCLASLLITLATAAAVAGEKPEPICARPNVLDQVAEVLRQAGRPMLLDRTTVGEISTAPTNIVRCAVRVHRLAYDTNRYAYLPLDQSEVVQYTIELRHNGIFLRVN